MTALLTALGSGVGAKKILEFLMRKSPQLTPKIQSALASGLSAERVLKWFSKGNNFEQLKGEMESEYSMNQNANPLVQAQNVRSQNLAPDMASGLQRNAPALLAGAGGLAASMALKHALPNPLKDSIPETPEKSQGISQPPPIIPQGQPAQSNPIVPQPQAPVQPEGISNIPELIKKSGLAKHIEEISKNVKDPKGVAAVLYNKFPKEMQKLQKEAGKPMEEVVAEYMGSQPEVMEKPPETAEIPPTKEEISPEVEKVEEKPIKIEKGSVAASPQGIGEVKEIRNGQVIIEIDGKKHKVSEDKLENPLFSEDEIADAYEDLFKKIPEVERSGFISWAGYDEDKNELGFIPRGGKYEVLHDITPEEAQLIKEGKGVARTTGERTEGLWAIGEDTRGGIISQIIHDRKKKQKEQQAKQLEFPLELPKPEKVDRGMKPVFDEMAYARNLSRAREKKKRDEEKARLKKEKEDEKARKKRKK